MPEIKCRHKGCDRTFKHPAGESMHYFRTHDKRIFAAHERGGKRKNKRRVNTTALVSVGHGNANIPVAHTPEERLKVLEQDYAGMHVRRTHINAKPVSYKLRADGQPDRRSAAWRADHGTRKTANKRKKRTATARRATPPTTKGGFFTTHEIEQISEANGVQLGIPKHCPDCTYAIYEHIKAYQMLKVKQEQESGVVRRGKNDLIEVPKHCPNCTFPLELHIRAYQAVRQTMQAEGCVVYPL